MNIALIGNGGRESALAWAIRKSPRCSNLFILPGNGGTTKYGRNIPVSITPPFTDLLEFIEVAEIDLVIVGPEQPLVDGIVDVLQKKRIQVFGPSMKASRLEGSKAYMKEFLYKYAIPTAQYKVFSNPNDAMDYVIQKNRPFVVKTDGLAAGKGAIVNKTPDETLKSIHRVLVDKEFGDAGNKVIIEDLLEGQEVSVFIVTDGKNFRWLASAQDHKRIFDNDEGPNTGGMGAYAPAPFITEAMKNIITENIVRPTIIGMQKEGYPYTGVLYVGLMLTKSGPCVIEYNIRFGDPEAQVVLPLLKTDFLDIVLAANSNKLDELKLEYQPGYCTCVVLAAEGYPNSYTKGKEITGNLKDAASSFVFHAGTTIDSNKLVTSGGRVLCVSALGLTLKQSIENAYSRVKEVSFEGMQYRKDIGKKGLHFFEKI